ncbi:N-acetylmuramoyl-L-alanine amidase [Dethiobacter alkaliphilus]|uniref:N-acetylmuramoyl-L-alanine amidase n=1 Tax=Dethiobacter alkaliphilus TaxID=427926 RepID=UPI00222622FC|nr:N-acetylmuramoyl-L-alanine amidase [Dethiobacter alkaliphilus]MCW3490626.1 N-acetylmuramoyl-L-alanine amidase [Dethiobacter alkaliphilus]
MRVTFYFTPKVDRRARILICLVLILAAVLLLQTVLGRSSTAMVSGLPLTGKTIVIDPGHGGYDPGVASNNITEKVVALGISVALRDYLQSAGARVVMTRETDRDLLVLPTAGPKKNQDMKNRLKIIEDANPDLLISVHANAISAPRWRGAQVFYRGDCEASRMLAQLLQQELIRVLENTNRKAKPGDYLVLNKSKVPGAMVETGFISNPEEAGLLSDPHYQSKVAWAIYVAINQYLDTTQ